jgi:hypothetical protein
MAESKSVVIKLTNEQREAIRKATGQNIGELKVEALEGRVTPWSVGRAEVNEARKAPFGEWRDSDMAEARKAPAVDAFLEERKAPSGFGVRDGGDAQEARKAPTGLGLNEDRKAPTGFGLNEDRKAPTGIVPDDSVE